MKKAILSLALLLSGPYHLKAMEEQKVPTAPEQKPGLAIQFLYPEPEEGCPSSDEESVDEKDLENAAVKEWLEKIQTTITTAANKRLPETTTTIAYTANELAKSDVPVAPIKKYLRDTIAYLKAEKGTLKQRRKFMMYQKGTSLETAIQQNLQPNQLLFARTKQLWAAENQLRYIQLNEQMKAWVKHTKDVTQFVNDSIADMESKKEETAKLIRDSISAREAKQAEQQNPQP